MVAMPARRFQGQGAQMAEIADNPKQSDYSCKILSFIVLFILSALSHFWYILFVFCAGIVLWGAVVLVGKGLASAALTWKARGLTHQGNESDSGNQVF
jgi:hypothetical protein